MKTKKNNKTINIVTMGCSKNLVDSEVMMKQFQANGLSVIHNSDSKDARIVIVNTCGFINDAKEESIDTILQFARAKEKGEIDNLFVVGCLSQRYKPDLQKEIPDVDGFFGTNDLKVIVESLGYDYKSNLLGERVISTPNHYAYLKISEGCDRQCSFCAIPLIRGKHQSKPIEEIIHEANFLAANGTKELILIAQDLTYYGIDLYKKQTLDDILLQLVEIDRIEWIRLHYAYPANFPKEILKIMRNEPKICNYLDIPFQHISDTVLKNMRRSITGKQTYELINIFKNEIPDLTLRTTLMVGHPGEGEKEFLELMDFVEKVEFDRLGVFKYSEEEGTYGARNHPDIVHDEIKQQRADQLMDLQSTISLKKNIAKIDSFVKTIIDRKEGNYYIGRSQADSPEVDNEILIESNLPLKIGSFYTVKIHKAEDFDLFATLID
jgi:ribosomal protein S12 methylthiotransferase